MTRKTRISVAREHFNAQRFKEALEIVSKFPAGLTREEKSILSRGYECFIRPEFYASLGKDPEACKEEAKVLFYQKWLAPKKKKDAPEEE